MTRSPGGTTRTGRPWARPAALIARISVVLLLSVSSLAFPGAAAKANEASFTGDTRSGSQLVVGANGASGTVAARFVSSDAGLFCCSAAGGLKSGIGSLFAAHVDGTVYSAQQGNLTSDGNPSVTGAGTVGDPYVFSSGWNAGPLYVTQRVTFVAAESTYELSLTASNYGTEDLAAVRIFTLGDVFVPGGANGAGQTWSSTSSVTGGEDWVRSTASDGTAVTLRETNDDDWSGARADSVAGVLAPLTSPTFAYSNQVSSTQANGALGAYTGVSQLLQEDSIDLEVTWSYTAPSTPGAPQIAGITSGATIAPSRTTTFSPATNDPTPVSYECKIDNGFFDVCGTGTTAEKAWTFTPGPHTLTVRAVNSAGVDGPTSAVSFTVANNVPAAPVVTATGGNTTIAVSFPVPANGGSAITGYQYRLNSGSWMTLTPTVTAGNASATLTGLTNGDYYDIHLRANNVNGDGAVGSVTEVLVGAVPDAPVVTAEGDNESIDVEFPPPANNGAGITRYEVAIGTGPWTTLSLEEYNGIQYGSTSGQINGQVYSVRVRAVNSFGAGAPSISRTVTVADDVAAPVLTAVPGNGEATLSWDTPSYDGGSPITGYVWRVKINGGDASDYYPFPQGPGNEDVGLATRMGPATPLPNGRWTAKVTGLTNGLVHEFRIRGVNAAQEGDSSNRAAATPAAPPSAPDLLLTESGNGTGKLYFNEPSSDGGSAITTWDYSLDGGTTWTVFVPTVGSDSLTYDLMGLTNGTTYSAKVRANNAASKGVASNARQVRPVGPATAVRDLAASPRDGALKLSWLAPSSLGGSPLVRYEYRYGSGPYTALDATMAGGTYTATVAGLTNESEYILQVRAVTEFGVGAVTQTTGTPWVLPAPTGVTATAGTSKVEVFWNAVAPEGRVAGYRVTAEPGSASCETSSATATSCVLGGVAGTSYTVSVVALGTNGVTSLPGTGMSMAVPVIEVPTTVPDGETTLTTDKGAITAAEPGEQITVLGFGFAPFSTAKVIIYSTPTVLATVTTDANGDFSAPVTIPAGLEAGDHTFVAMGVDPQGATRTLTLPVKVAAASTGDPGDSLGAKPDKSGDLPKTGGAGFVQLWVLSAGFLVGGALLLRIGARGRRNAVR